MCARCGRMMLVENTRSTGAEVAGVQKSRRNNGFKASYFFQPTAAPRTGPGTHYFYIIWLPSRKRQYAVVLPWLRCGQGQGLKAKAKAKAKAITFKAKADIFWPQAKAKA